MELYDKPLLVIASETDAILPLVPSAVKPRSFKWHQMLGATSTAAEAYWKSAPSLKV